VTASEPIRDISPIYGDDLTPVAVGSAFDVAHQTAKAASAERLRVSFPPEFAFGAMAAGELSKPIVGTVKDDELLADVDPWELVEHAVSQWLRADDEAPMGMALEASGRPDGCDELLPSPLGHDPLPARSVSRMATMLDDGYMLALHGATDRHPPLQRLLEDLERALGVAVVSTLFAGVRTTLGPLPSASVYDRLMIQVGGRRHVGLTHSADERGHMTLRQGHVLFVPAGWIARHEPIDEDTVHLELTLTRPRPEPANSSVPAGPDDDVHRDEAIDIPEDLATVWRAWLPTRGATSLSLATRALAHQAWSEVSVRLALPGGVYVVGDPDAGRFAAGGFEFTVAPDSVTAVAGLLASEGTPGADVEPLLLEGLLRAGLLTVTAT